MTTKEKKNNNATRCNKATSQKKKSTKEMQPKAKLKKGDRSGKIGKEISE